MAVTDDQKQRLIVAQNSATAAAGIYQAVSGPEWDAELYDDIRAHIFDGSMALGLGTAVTEGEAVSNVVQAFPGAQVTSAPQKVTVLRPVDDNHPAWLDQQWQWLVDKGDIQASDNEVWDNRKFHTTHGGKSDPDKAAWYATSKGKVKIYPPRNG